MCLDSNLNCNMVKIIIDPACNFYYSSFYVQGLFELHPHKIIFSSSPFRDLSYTKHTHIFAFIFQEENKTTKAVIDFADSTKIEKDFLGWSDVYGKINLEKQNVVDYENKIVSIAPNFAIKVWNKKMSTIKGLLNYLKSYNRTVEFRLFLSRYLMTLKRMPIFEKPEFITPNNLIFFYSTYWEGQDATNNHRKNFIRACKNIKEINFEGGLVNNDFNCPNSDIFIKNRINHHEYISKIKKSVIVFNTPAYHLCHGWKLGEYLALGKAIISTPLFNELPEKLEHEKNIYYVNGDLKGIEQAIHRLLNNKNLREHLERGAYTYYKKNVAPIAVIKKLIDNSRGSLVIKA